MSQLSKVGNGSSFGNIFWINSAVLCPACFCLPHLDPGIGGFPFPSTDGFNEDFLCPTTCFRVGDLLFFDDLSNLCMMFFEGFGKTARTRRLGNLPWHARRLSNISEIPIKTRFL